MSASQSHAHDTPFAPESEVRSLYQRLLHSWNTQDADAYAAAFAGDGVMIGFDGSTIVGQLEIQAHLRALFRDHRPPAYVANVSEVRFLGADIGLLRAIAGMAWPGSATIEPSLNAVQTLLAQRRDGAWRIAQFQTTPAQLHGRPDDVRQMTEDLEKLLG